MSECRHEWPKKIEAAECELCGIPIRDALRLYRVRIAGLKQANKTANTIIQYYMQRDTLMQVSRELVRANSMFPSFSSAHEGIAVIREEYLELEHEVFHGTKEAAITEAIQLAAMGCKLLQFYAQEDETK